MIKMWKKCYLLYLLTLPLSWGNAGPFTYFSIEKIASQLTNPEKVEFSTPFRVMHPELRTQILALNLRDKIIPLYYDENLTQPVHEEFLIAMTKQQFGLNLARFFSAREGAEKEYEFEWVMAPEFDYYSRRLTFSLLLLSDSKPVWIFAKSIRLLDSGYVSLEIDQPWHPALQELSRKMDMEFPVQEVLSTGLKRGQYLSPSRIFHDMILPKSPTPITYKVEEGQSFVEQNRRSIGGLFLLVSVLFFILAPKGKN